MPGLKRYGENENAVFNVAEMFVEECIELM